MVKSTRHIQAFFLGKLDYFSSIDLQEKINLEVQENKKEDHILFLEHDNVVTFGSQEKISDLFLKPKEITLIPFAFALSDKKL